MRLLEWMQRGPAHERRGANKPLLAVGGAIWGAGVVLALSGAWTLAWLLGMIAVVVCLAARLR